MGETIYISGPTNYTIVNDAIWKGSASPFLKSFSGKFSPTSGWSFNQKFSGLSVLQMQTLANIYSASGCAYTVSYDNGMATLETEDNRGNVTIDTWEIGVNRTTRGCLQNPLNIAALGGVGSVDLLALASFAAGDVVVTGTQTQYDATKAYIVAGDNNPAALRLLDRMNTGQDSYQFDQYTLRHNTNASNRGYYNVADLNVNCIYTYANLIGEITNFGYWIFPAPPEILGAISDIFAGLASPLAYYMQGALKGGSQRTTTANNRINISTEYALDVWSTDEYTEY